MSLAVDPAAGAIDSRNPLKDVAFRVAARLQQTEIEALVEAVERLGQVPRDIDAQLLGGARGEIGHDLNPTEKKDLRNHFVEECRARML